jgi:hypothetical protein
MAIICPEFFNLHPAEILERVKKQLDQEPLEEGIKELLLEDIKKKLAYGTDLYPGVGFTASPLSFLEEIFWTVVTEGEKTLRVKIIPTGGLKLYFDILEELPEPPVEEIPSLSELMKFLPGTFLCLGILLKNIKGGIHASWNNPQDLEALLEILTPGEYIIHLSTNGIDIYPIEWEEEECSL